MKSVAFHNLGCKVNSYEMDVMQQYLQENGYEIVDFEQKADIYIINTCTVTNIADRKSRQMLHRAKKQNPQAIVVAVGCYVQTAKDDIELDDSIDLAIGNNRKKDLVQIIEQFLKERDENGIRDKTLEDSTIIDVRNTDTYEEMTLESTMEHTRAYIKIQDGCDQFCSYCIIPFARGKVRSRKPEQVVDEVKRLAKSGYHEIVLTGIHLSSYGLDFDGVSYNQAYREEDGNFHAAAEKLLALMEELEEIEGITRIRLGSLEPRIITMEFAKRLVQMKKVCPHFHLSLQSGCDSVLKRMNRKYTTKDFIEGVSILRQVYDRPAITTDVITGFPGETEEEFAITVEFLEKIQFFEMHIFPYSKRKGTVAASLPGQLSEKEKKDRSSVLLKMDERDSTNYRNSYVGSDVEVLFEQTQTIDGEEYYVGHTRNYIKVAIKTQKDMTNCECICRIQKLLRNDILLGEIIN